MAHKKKYIMDSRSVIHFVKMFELSNVVLDLSTRVHVLAVAPLIRYIPS